MQSKVKGPVVNMVRRSGHEEVWENATVFQAPGCRLFYSVHGESALVSVVCVCVENVACEEVRLRVTEEPKGNSGVHCLNQVLKVCPWLKQSINIKVTHKTERLCQINREGKTGR